MPSESYFQADMSAMKKKYLHGSEWGYVSMAEYMGITNAQQQYVYRLHDERYVTRRAYTRDSTYKEYDKLNRQVSVLSKKVDNSLTT